MTTIKAKPVKKCLGCALNLGKTCGMFTEPALKWKKRNCEGYNNPSYVEMYERAQHPEGKYARKVARAGRAKLAHTTDHHNGQHRPGG